MGAGEPGMLSPSPPTHGPLAHPHQWVQAIYSSGVPLQRRASALNSFEAGPTAALPVDAGDSRGQNSRKIK